MTTQRELLYHGKPMNAEPVNLPFNAIVETLRDGRPDMQSIKNEWTRGVFAWWFSILWEAIAGEITHYE